MLWSSPYCIIWVQFIQYNTTHSFSHLNVLAFLILVTFSYRILLHSLEIFSLILDLFLVSLLSICALLTSGHSIHCTAIADLADTHNIDVFALTETWISPNTTSAQLFDAIPREFTFINTPRPVPISCTSSIISGSTAFLLRKACKLLATLTATFKSFELSSVTIKLPHSNLALYNIYRPQSTTESRYSVSFSQFLADFQTLISSVSTSTHEFLITGDFTFLLMTLLT